MSEPRASRRVDFEALPEVPRGSSLAAEWWLALSHLRSRKHAFLSVVTTLSIVGVVVGVAVLNVVLSVMTGFEEDLREKILGTNAHIVVLRYGGNIEVPADKVERIEELDGVVAAAPFIYTELIIRSAWDKAGVIVKGIDTERTHRVTSLREDLEYGLQGELSTDSERMELFAAMAEPFGPSGPNSQEEESLPGILIGRELMEQLQVYPGDRVQLINPLGSGGGLMGLPTPTVKNLRVAGVFYSGMYEYDTKWTYVHNDAIADFLDYGDEASGIEVRVEDIDSVEQLSAEIDELLGYPHHAKHWKSLNSALFEALKLEKVVMGLILSMIVMVAGLLIVTTLIMVVMTKGRQIAILKAMGAAPRSIQRVFMIEGAIIGLVGTIVGTILGYVGCLGLRQYEYPLETDVYYLSSLPVVIEPINFVVIGVAAFAICFMATLYPAWEAARLDPVEGLRYE